MSYQEAVKNINGVWSVINAAFDGVWDFLQRGRVMRRSAFVLMWFLTFEAYHFCYTVAEQSNWDAATIGATFGILTPVSGLQAAVMKFYNDARTTDTYRPTQG